MRKRVVEKGVHNYTPEASYVTPKEKEVQEHLKWFMGLKLGLMIHWAPGCQFGTYESWPLSDGDGEWSQEDIDWTDIETFKKQYINGYKTFNPVKFRPDKWAKLAKDCGFKYLLMTTKHHDGFCMFDTKTTDYKITNPECPFHSHPNAEVIRRMYDEFRKQGLAISTYFSKPDWHSDYYWHREFGTALSRDVNYDVKEHPELWAKFVEYTHKQIEELGTEYGKIDVLWLDGGWVSKGNKGQDIRLEEIVGKLRSTTQPHLIVCDRGQGGEFENFVTPEKTVPDQALLIPWESCTPIGNHFSFRYTDEYKTGKEIVHLFIEVVAKGGNLALNIGPQPDGVLPAMAVQSIMELGHWLSVFGEGIYETVPQAPYVTEELCFTRKGNFIYVFYLYEEDGVLPEQLQVPLKQNVKSVITMRDFVSLSFSKNKESIQIDTKLVDRENGLYAEGFAIEIEA